MSKPETTKEQKRFALLMLSIIGIIIIVVMLMVFNFVGSLLHTKEVLHTDEICRKLGFMSGSWSEEQGPRCHKDLFDAKGSLLYPKNLSVFNINLTDVQEVETPLVGS